VRLRPWYGLTRTLLPISDPNKRGRNGLSLSMLSRRPIQLPPPGRNDCGPGVRRGTIPYHTTPPHFGRGSMGWLNYLYGRHRSQSAKEDIAHPYPANASAARAHRNAGLRAERREGDNGWLPDGLTHTLLPILAAGRGGGGGPAASRGRGGRRGATRLATHSSLPVD
jgi:hypothetical protein